MSDYTINVNDILNRTRRFEQWLLSLSAALPGIDANAVTLSFAAQSNSDEVNARIDALEKALTFILNAPEDVRNDIEISFRRDAELETINNELTGLKIQTAFMEV